MRSSGANTRDQDLDPGAGRAGAWVGDRFAHEALLFGDERQLLARCVPFVREALEAGQPVLAMASDRTMAVLREPLGSDADSLEVLGTPDNRWLGGHETLLAYDRDFQRVTDRGVPWRLIAEPTWLRRPDGQEWHRFESACNRLLASVPYYSLCLHDRRSLGEGVLATVRRTHPLVWDEHGLHASEVFLEPESLVPSLEPPWSPVPPEAAHADVVSAGEGRAAAAVAAEAAGLAARRDEVVVAVHELVANSLACTGAARIDYWRNGTHLYLQVTDRGPGGLGPLMGYGPPSHAGESGRGLWLARALADDATLRSGPSGSSVRLLFMLPPGR